MASDGLVGAQQLLATHRDRLLPEWIETAATRLRGRMTRPELEAELTNIYAALSSETAADDPSEVQAVVAALSRSRARHGFSPTETAAAITSLKDPVIPLVRDGTLSLDDLVAVAALVDELGLLTFETYVTARNE